MNLPVRVLSVVGVIALGVAAIGLGCAVRALLPGLGMPAAVAQDNVAAVERVLPQATAEMFTHKGRICGKVLIEGREVIATTYSKSGVEAYERASIAAARISLALQDGVAPEDFRAMEQDGEWVVVAGSRVIISLHRREAKDLDITLQDLAERWASNIAMALHEAFGTRPGAEGTEPLPPVVAEAQRLDVAGAEVGVLVVNGAEVLRITAGAPGLTPFERAQIVADRLRQAVADGALPQDIRAADLYGMAVVQVSEMLLITVNEADAQKAGKSPEVLAREWAGKLSEAVAGHYAGAGHPIEPPPGGWQPTEPYDDKWVPIISVLEGVKLGIARVNGPRSRVRLVQAVAQLETHWKDYLEIDIYVPISTKVPGEKLDRVDGCAVTGLADIRL